MSLMHGQTNGHVVARREVSAEDLSEQLENRHFIHARSAAFFHLGQLNGVFFFCFFFIVRVGRRKCDSGNTM